MALLFPRTSRLTLDSFTTLDRELKTKIIEEKNSVAETEEEIVAEDRRHIIFCSIEGLEEVLSRCTEDALLATLTAARKEKYVGWELPQINQEEVAGKKIKPKKFPFELDGLLPWWKEFDELEDAYEEDASED